MPENEHQGAEPARVPPLSETDSFVDEPVTALYTTAGDLEREAYSRRANAFEALAVISVLLGAFWGACYWLGILRGTEVASTAGQFAVVLCIAYALVIGPLLHRDSAASRGLGSPGSAVKLLGTGPLWRRAAGALLMAVVFVGVCLVTYLYWPAVISRAGFRETVLYELHRAYPGRFYVFAIGGLAAAGVVLFAVRYDNLFSAFRKALLIILPLLALMLSVAWLLHGTRAFAGLRPDRLGESFLQHMSQGFALELVFSAYLCTRLRKAFAPPEIVPRKPRTGRWLAKAMLIGLNLAILVYLVSLFGLRLRHGVDRIPLSIPFTIATVFLPLGIVFGLLYSLQRTRLLVATLVASMFASIHMDSYFLVAATWLMGVPVAYVFMQDRNRNLAAVAVVHGVLGGSFHLLFGSGRFGPLDVRMAVGPFNIEHPTREVLVVPLIWMVAYGCIALWCWRNLSAEEPSETV